MTNSYLAENTDNKIYIVGSEARARPDRFNDGEISMIRAKKIEDILITLGIPRNRLIVIKSGTSMAAPFVSAAVAMYILDNPNLDSAQIRQNIEQFVYTPPRWNSLYGKGIIDISLAMPRYR